jgi:phosphatidylglycerol:prolipoprotein diacylglycerol transferase
MFHLYGFFIGLAVVVGYSVAEKIEPKVSRVAPWVLGLGLVGARLYHVIDFWEYYSQNLSQIVAVWKGGLGIWGGIMGGGVGLWIASSRAKSRPACAGRDPSTTVGMTSVLGAMVIGLPVAQAIGRLGNAVNGEFFDKVWILPWWGAEMMLDLILFGVLGKMHLSGVSRKVIVGSYLVGYFLIRLILNPFRMDLR